MHLRHRIAAALPLAAFALVAPSTARAQDVVAITRRASPAVVTLHAFNSTGREVSLGSGFFLPDGRIATNRHVVEGATRLTAKAINDRTLGNAEYAEAVGRTVDLAILPRIGAPPATLTLATRLPEAGESVVVIGAPEGLSNTVSTGIVSAIRSIQGRTLVQISAPISHGSSGGPVLNMRGEVIGVSVSVLSEGQNLNFAVPATELLTLSQARPEHIAFTSNLRGDAPGRTNGPDISTQNLARLPRIAIGQTVTGRLVDGDFVRPDGSYADSYVYMGRAGERIIVTQRSRDFDSWVVVDDPHSATWQESDDDSGGNLDAELTVTLPRDGPYLIVANSVAAQATGSYSMSLRSAGRGPVDPGSGGAGRRGTLTDLGRLQLPRIAAGQTVNGQLSTSDFLRTDDNTYVDGYTYAGRAGERLTVTMRSGAFDSWLVLDDPNGPMRENDDDGAGGNDAQITVTLPHDGNYVIVANSVSRSSGAYSLTVRSSRGGGDPTDDGDGDDPVTPRGGSGGTIADLGRMQLPRIVRGQSVSGRLAQGDFVRSDDNTFADGYFYQGRAGEQVTIVMRSSAFDSWLVFDDPNGPMQESDDDGAGGNDSRLTVTLPHDGRYLIVANAVRPGATGNYTLTVQGSGGGDDGGSSGDGNTGTIADLGRMRLPGIAAGQSVSGRLASGDFVRSDDDSYADGYFYQGRAGEQITVTLRSSAFDSWLVVDDPTGPLQEHDDDSAGGNDAQVTLTLPHAGRYLIIANSIGARATGAYTLTVRSGGGGGRKY
ncbi:pre-peptidase C-terminal domain-containing protein [bacterium JGI 053]|nr:pre-peptidase C-terminal domain-containing protein [bacterium JGI 053]